MGRVTRRKYAADLYPHADTRCPCCGQTVRGIQRIGRSWQCWPCGDVLTTEQAWPILAARGDLT